jgi:membrane fusion protein (multidrug efflux system)
MTKKRNWGIAGISAAFVLGAVSFLLVIRSRTTAGESAALAPDVEVVSVEQRDIPVYREWIGTLDGLVNAAIRSQVTGYLLTRKFSEGSLVKKGQLLFEIDPRPLQPAADQAKGQLAQANGQLPQAQAQYHQPEAQLAGAEANQRQAQFHENRYTPRCKTISRRKRRSRWRLRKLYSPIDGIAGNTQIKIGNLVSPATSAVTTLSTVDTIKVSPPSMRAVQHFGRPSEPKVGVVQIHEFIRHPEWTYAR